MTDILSGLNEKQKEMVLSTEGPILVLAGAGSGKTKALTHRIAYLISEKKVNPERILAITFTNKAAKEMTERVEKLLQRGAGRPTMGTFHSVCARVLRKEAGLLGYPHNFVIFDADDSLRVVKHCLKRLNLPSDKVSPQNIRGYISGAKNQLVGPSEYEKIATSYRETNVAEIYRMYQEELRKNEAMDFDDLLWNMVKIFRENPATLEKYQDLWQYILVDEYQDTNEAQYVFVKLLAEKNRNLCVVGDDWQSIYSWRGANFQNILDFERDYPEAKVIKLEQNYRSTKAILTAAQTVIEKNQNRSKKTLWTENEAGAPINLYEARSEEDEAAFIAREASRLLGKGYSYRDMAVFYRTNAQSRSIEEQMLRYRIPYKIVGGVRFYERKEIKDILAWLRVASGASDFIAFERSLSTPPSGIGKVSLAKIKSLLDEGGLKLGEIGQDPSLLGDKIAKILTDYFAKIKRIKEAEQTSLGEAIGVALKVSGILEYLNDGSFQAEERIENLKELLSVAAEYEKLKGKLSLSDFLEEVALISDVDNYQEKQEGITMMTVHTAKGLEFKVVFMVGLEENIFPHSRSLFDLSELEEERRLFYVGMTRAREILYLLYSERRLYFGSIQSNQPSRFVAEIPEPFLAAAGESAPKESQVSEEQIPGGIKVGDKVEHENFGKGEVREVFEDELTVYFPGYGKKVISVYYAPIKKL